MDLDTLSNLVGDTPVSEQIYMAIEHHDHSNYADRNEVEELKRKIEVLLNLIGDTPVSEQIAMALKNIK